MGALFSFTAFFIYFTLKKLSSSHVRKGFFPLFVSREKLFRLVRILDEEGSYGALMELLPELTVFPAAYLSAGRTKIRHGGRISETPVELFVIDRFSDEPGRDVESFRTLKSVKESISFNPGDYRLSLGNVRYQLQDIENVPLDEEHIAWCLKISAVASC